MPGALAWSSAHVLLESRTPRPSLHFPPWGQPITLVLTPMMQKNATIGGITAAAPAFLRNFTQLRDLAVSLTVYSRLRWQ